jgi:hypothetical protein
MASAVKYETFVEDMANKLHDLFGTNDTVLAIIHTDAPVPSTDTAVGNLTQITGTGYAAADIQNAGTRSGGTVTVTGVDYTWTATAADWTSTARYVSIYNDTSVTDRLILSWDYGATFAVGNGETFTLDFGASVFTLS